MSKKRKGRDREGARPSQSAKKLPAEPEHIPLQAWWMILMLGIILPALLVAWIALCAWAQKSGAMSPKIPAYAGLVGLALIAIRWLAFVWMLVKGRAIDLATDAVTFPAVTLFSLRPRRVAYRSIESVTQRSLSGQASEVIVVLRDHSEVSIPGVFQWPLERIEEALNARLHSAHG